MMIIMVRLTAYWALGNIETENDWFCSNDKKIKYYLQPRVIYIRLQINAALQYENINPKFVTVQRWR